MEKVNYTIINKDGKVLEDLSFTDYDELADHMLEMADKYYEGVYSPDDKLQIATFDENDKLVYSDVATFEETSEITSEIPDDFNISLGEISEQPESGRGFGKKTH